MRRYVFPRCGPKKIRRDGRDCEEPSMEQLIRAPVTLPDTIARRRQTVATSAKIVEFERPIILQTLPARNRRVASRRAALRAHTCSFSATGMYSYRISRCVANVLAEPTASSTTPCCASLGNLSESERKPNNVAINPDGA